MGIFDSFKKKKESMNSGQQDGIRTQTQSNHDNSILFSKNELTNMIKTLSTLSYMFRDSHLLKSTGGGRNEKMMSRLHSYAGIFGYYYEVEYQYGKLSEITDNQIATHYMLVKHSLSDSTYRNKIISELADNWSDVLQVINNMQLEPNLEGDRFGTMKSEIQDITNAIEKMSGGKCKVPKDPRNVTPKEVTYNPFKITENPIMCRGHCIPDLTNVFAQELVPQILSSQAYGKTPKDVVLDYAMTMIKSYYENAGFVPMVIVDQITGQINQVTEMVQRISYAPYGSLKECLLGKIYK